MIVRLYHTFKEFNEIRIEGYHLPNILNRLKRLHGFDAGKERAILLLVDSSKKVEPLQVVNGFELRDVSGFDTLNVLREDNIKDIDGSWPGIEILAVLSAIGVIQPNTKLLNAIFAVMDWVMMVASAVASIFVPGLGLALSLWYALVKFAFYYGAHDDPAQLQADAQQYQSNLYNGVPLLREQGGICPLIFGQPYASGVLLSSALVTSDQVA